MKYLHCSCCKKQRYSAQTWTLNNYHGLSGRFCSECYDKVSHDSYGKPKHPAQYTWILLKMAV